MKISPAGDKLALAVSRNNNFELFDFNSSTGVVSNPIILPASNYTYGIEFSRDGKILYAAEFFNKIYQYDLSLGSAAAIIASQLLLLPTPTGVEIGSIQMAPDGKIYVCKNSSNFVGVINNPATLGQGCNYVDNGFSIAPNIGQEGLPNFIQSIFTEAPALPVALFNTPDNHICPGTCTDFTNLSVNGLTYLWSFPGANPSTSTDINPTNICYNTPGNYLVSLISSNAAGSDTLSLSNFITVYPNPPPQGISQNGDTLFAIQGAVSYQWFYDGNLLPGATDYFYVASGSGDYNVVATDANGCEVEAAIFDVIADITEGSGEENILMVFPNPADAYLFISGLPESRGNGITSDEIIIYSLVGEKVIDIRNTSNHDEEMKIDIRTLPAGLYIVEITSAEKNFRTKFIKSITR
jgi:PKD repeat protein